MVAFHGPASDARRFATPSSACRAILHSSPCTPPQPTLQSKPAKGQIDKHNINQIPTFLEALRGDQFVEKMFLIFNPITPPRGFSHHCSRFSMSTEEQVEWMERLYAHAWHLGFPRSKVFEQRDALCMATLSNSFVVSPSGAVYKCGALVGQEAFQVGHVSKPGLSPRYNELMAVRPWLLCPECQYLPLCGGVMSVHGADSWKRI